MTVIQKESLKSVEQLKKILDDFKRIEKSTLSNYIPDPVAHKKWVESGRSFIHYFDSSIFISYDAGNMIEVTFLSKSRDKIMECLDFIKNGTDKPVVVEHVFREGKDEQIGSPTCVLRRMSRSGNFETPTLPSKRVEKATFEDITEILDIFNCHFDPLTERIPDNEELKRLILINGISIIRENNQIVGMVIYEKNTTNIHLRYWWVSPSSRNKGVGSNLLKDYFHEGHECKRQFLWVFSDNMNAIEKYLHYGFKFDGTADEIYIIR